MNDEWWFLVLELGMEAQNMPFESWGKVACVQCKYYKFVLWFVEALLAN